MENRGRKACESTVLEIRAFERDVVAGLNRASELADGGAMVVAGSLYLVGSVLRALRESEA